MAVIGTMENMVQFDLRDVYGRPTAYPVNDTARHLCQIAGTKTLTPNTVSIAGRMGFRFYRAIGEPSGLTMHSWTAEELLKALTE